MSLLYIKINLKWIIDLNVRARISKRSESVRRNCDSGKSDFHFFFEEMAPKAQSRNYKIKTTS